MPPLPFTRCLRPDRAAFSLTELLVVIGILLALTLVTLPGFSRAAERARSGRCVHKLRQISVLLYGIMGENNGRLQLFIDGSAGGEKRWYNQAMRYAGYTQDQAKAAFGCPSFKEDETGDWFCYGIRVAGSPGEVKRDTPESPRLYNIVLSAIPDPGQFLWMADSLNYVSARQSFRLHPTDLRNDSGIHLRHSHRANVLFLDGHIRSLDAAGLAQAGVTQAIDDKGQILSTH